MSSLDSAFIDFGIDPLAPDSSLVDVWQRFSTNDKPQKKNGAVCFKPDGAVIIKNWATDETTVWREHHGSAAIPISRRRAKVKRVAEQTQKTQADAAAVGVRLWEGAKPAGSDHPYLARKNLPPLDLKETPNVNGWRERWLICPLYSEPLERIRNLECINSVGDKRPIKGALRRAVYGFAGPGMPTDSVVICEGWATAAALHVCLDMPVVFAAGKGNLVAVAELWRKGLPSANIIIAADDDVNNAGLEEAKKAAHATDGWIKKPNFGRLKRNRSDWCDVYTDFGAEFVRQGWLHG